MESCWEDLANAIILQAVEDYRKARKVLKKYPDNKEANDMIRDTESFFRSDWYCMLTDIDGDKLKETLRREPIWKLRII